jgi:hypothetical protein
MEPNGSRRTTEEPGDWLMYVMTEIIKMWDKEYPYWLEEF